MLLLHICLAAYCFSMLQKVQSAAELAAIMQRRRRWLLKQLPRKSRSRNRKPRSRELRSRPLATQIYSPQKQYHLVWIWGSKNFNKCHVSLCHVLHPRKHQTHSQPSQFLHCSQTHTSLLLGLWSTVQASEQVLLMRLDQLPMVPQAAASLFFMTVWNQCMI